MVGGGGGGAGGGGGGVGEDIALRKMNVHVVPGSFKNSTIYVYATPESRFITNKHQKHSMRTP